MPALALLSTNDHDISVNTQAAKETLAGQLDSLSIVTAYAHAIGNTFINPVTTPPEAWFTSLQTNLKVAQQHAVTWIAEIHPKIGSEIPQTIINFNNTFMSATDALLEIIGDKQSLTKEEKMEVIEIIDFVLGTLNDQKSTVNDLQKRIDDLADDFEHDHKALMNGQNGAAEALRIAELERKTIENKIVELQTELEQARQRVTVSGIGLGLSIFLAVAAFSLAVATGGTGLLVAGAVGVVGIGTAATFTGIYSVKVNRLLDEIAQQQRTLENKTRQVTALKGLVQTLDSLRGHNEAAKTALTDISKMWHSLGEKLESVLSELKQGKLAEETMMQRVNILTARTNWTETAEFAQKFQHQASGTQVQPPLQHVSLVSAF